MKTRALLFLGPLALAACGGSEDSDEVVADSDGVTVDGGGGVAAAGADADGSSADGTDADPTVPMNETNETDETTESGSGASTVLEDDAGTEPDDGAQGATDEQDIEDDTAEADPDDRDGIELDDSPIEFDESLPGADGESSDLARSLEALGSVERFTEDNFRDVIAAVATIHRNEANAQVLDLLARMERDIRSGETPLSPLGVQIDGANRVHGCPGGGLLKALVDLGPEFGPDNPVAGSGLAAFEFDECVLDGEYGLASISGGWSYSFIQSPVDVAITYPDGGEIDTRFILSESRYPSEDVPVRATTIRNSSYEERPEGSAAQERSFRSDIVYIRVTREDETAELARAPFLLTSTVGGEAGFVEMRLGSPRRELTVETSDLFVAESAGENYSTGQVEFTITSLLEDIGLGVPQPVRNVVGRMVVQAANGDPDTFDVVLFADENTVASYTVEWAPEYVFDIPALIVPQDNAFPLSPASR